MATMEKSAITLISTLMDYAGSDDYTRIHGLSWLNDGYALFLGGMNPYTGVPHTWSFLQPWAQLAIGGPQTGADATNSTDATLVQCPDGPFDESMVGLTVTMTSYDGTADHTMTGVIEAYIDANTVYLDTEITFSNDAGVAVSAGISIEGTGLVAMPSGFAGLVTPMVYQYSADATPRLQETNPESIYASWRDDNVVGDARWYAIEPLTFTAGTGQRWRMLFYPVMDQPRYVTYRYNYDADALTDAAVYPVGGARHSRTVEMMALAEAELKTGRTIGFWASRASAEMVGSIYRDEEQFKSNAPASLANTDTGIS